jgi:alpha-amylase
LVALTNKVAGGVQKFITYHPFNAGDKICNIFFPTTDCITVASGGFNVYLLNGEAKIYVAV